MLIRNNIPVYQHVNRAYALIYFYFKMAIETFIQKQTKWLISGSVKVVIFVGKRLIT